MWTESDFVALLRLFAAKRIGARAIGNALDLAASHGQPLHELADANENEFLKQISHERSPTGLALADESQAQRLHQELKSADIAMLVRGTPEYPGRLIRALGDNAPPVLFVWGNQRLLNVPSAAVCGSRAASSRGIEIAATCARMLAENGINVVSGYAKGVDTAAHEAAVRAGGTTTIVLAEGIFGFRKKNELRELLDGVNSVVVSQYSPRLPWAIHNAMQRNSTICGLADSIVLIETRESGGTFEAGKAALSMGVPLFVVEYAEAPAEASGNSYFLERGALALRRTPAGRPSLRRVVETVKSMRPDVGLPSQYSYLDQQARASELLSSR